MNNVFSKSVQYFLERYDAIQSGFDRFHNELGFLFRQLSDEIKPLGFIPKIYRFASGKHLLQFSCSNWGNDEGEGIHFEFFIDHEELAKKYLIAGLDFGDDVAEKSAKRTTLIRLLEPYKQVVLQRTGYELLSDKYWKFLRTTIPIQGLSVEAMRNECDILPDIAAFVDEAIFLADKKSVWRTDFLPTDQKPYIKWHEGLGTNEVGGWEFSQDGGRLKGHCLKCHGGKSNYHEGKNIIILQSNESSRNFGNGQKIYCSTVVHSIKGGQICFYAEAPKEGNFTVAFEKTCDLQPIDRWQVVSYEGQVSNPEHYDFAKNGLFIFLIAKVPEIGLRIDSIEIGLI